MGISTHFLVERSRATTTENHKLHIYLCLKKLIPHQLIIGFDKTKILMIKTVDYYFFCVLTYDLSLLAYSY